MKSELKDLVNTVLPGATLLHRHMIGKGERFCRQKCRDRHNQAPRLEYNSWGFPPVALYCYLAFAPFDAEVRDQSAGRRGSYLWCTCVGFTLG